MGSEVSISDYGDICEGSDSCFVWKIPDFINKIQQNYRLISPDFKLYGRSWCLRIDRNENESDVFMHISLQTAFSLFGDKRVVTYKLWIQDFERSTYWASPVLTEEIGIFEFCGIIQKLRKSHLYRDAGMIARGGVLSVHLMFNPPGGQPSQIQTVEQGVRTTSNLPCNQNSSLPVIDGVDKLVQNLKGLLLSGEKSDVTLYVEGRVIKAHIGILVSRSPVFAQMFHHNMVENCTRIVTITDCNAEVFHIFLIYLYTGKVYNLTVDSAIELYCIADKYRAEELIEGCIKFLLRNFSIESFCDIVVLSLQYGEEQLLALAYAFFFKHSRRIVVTEKWKSFIQENPDKANEILIKALS